MPANPDDLTPFLIQEAARRVRPGQDDLVRRAEVLAQQEREAQSNGEQPSDGKTLAVQQALHGSVPVPAQEGVGQEILKYAQDSLKWLNENFFNLRAPSQKAAEPSHSSPELVQELTRKGYTPREIERMTVDQRSGLHKWADKHDPVKAVVLPLMAAASLGIMVDSPISEEADKQRASAPKE